MLVRSPVAVRDHDVSDLELRDPLADFDDLAQGRIARKDLPAAHLGHVDRVGQCGVADVVLGRNREDLEADIRGTHVAQFEIVELDHARYVDLGKVSADAVSLGRNVIHVNRI